MSSTFQPLEDRLVVSAIEKKEPEKTEAGIIIPDSARKEVKEGIVVSIGPGRYAGETGNFIPTILHEGDKILFGAGQGMPIEIDKKEYLIMREGDVLMLLSTAKAD